MGSIHSDSFEVLDYIVKYLIDDTHYDRKIRFSSVNGSGFIDVDNSTLTFMGITSTLYMTYNDLDISSYDGVIKPRGSYNIQFSTRDFKILMKLYCSDITMCSIFLQTN
jgi:hypothetical protein